VSELAGRAGELRVIPISGLPEVAEGQSLGRLIAEEAELAAGDIVVVSQKVVSKARGSWAPPWTRTPRSCS
jgi:coenzyme F420-0:L-glutamate ligase/coenzyme F420-1:gamma-L-glutamate ligase